MRTGVEILRDPATEIPDWNCRTAVPVRFGAAQRRPNSTEMSKPIARDPMYRRRSFDADIIELCSRWYITYRLSYRDIVAMMGERGVEA